MFKQVLKDITTAQDGESFDIARVVIVANSIILIPVLVLGIGFFIYGYVFSKPFDVQTFFSAVLTYVGGVGTLLTTGSAAIYFKKTTEPDGTVTEVTSIKDSKQEPQPEYCDPK